MGFFDGACKRRRCRCGVVIVINPGKYYHFWWVGGQGTNSKAKLIALWGFLIVAKWQRIDSIQIFGNAKGIIDWVENNTSFSLSILKNWMCRIWVLVSIFQVVNFVHIYREHNWIADLLSKRRMMKPTCRFFFSVFEQGHLNNEVNINYS